jgi:hypothetical protein
LTTQTITPSIHPTKMRRNYIVSGILLILPIIDFAVAAPMLVQEKHQAGVDAVHIPEDAITVLGKRGDDLNKLFFMFEDHFAKPEESSATRPSSSPPSSGSDRGQMNVKILKKPPPSNPEGWSPASSDHGSPSPGSLKESEYELTKWDASPGPSSPASGPSTESNADHRLVVEEPPSRPASPTEFDADYEYQVVHPPLPSPGSASATEFDADHGYQVVHPPPLSPGSASPTESDHDMVDVSPSSSVSSRNYDRWSDPRSENLQAVSDGLKGNAKESHRISSSARDVLNVARSLNPG